MKKIHKLAIAQKRVNSKKESAKNLKLFGAVILIIALYNFGSNGVSASEITAQKVIELTNADRAEKGLSILAENNKLKKAAENKAEDMIEHDYFSHNSPGGVTPWHWIEQEKYDYDYAGENLAMDFNSAEKMNEAWLASPTHRANIMNEKYKDIGIAVKEGVINGHATIDVVQMFGSGDRNEKDKLREEKSSLQKKNEKDTFFPPLPLENKNRTIISNSLSTEPVITSPTSKELVSKKTLEVVGRAAAKEKVAVWIDSREIGQATSDENGWFHYKIEALTEGTHSLKVQSAILSDRKNPVEKIRNDEVSFFVDRSKPQVSYRLSADSYASDGYFLEVTSDKPSCVFEIGGEAINARADRKAFFSFTGKNLSTILKVEDQAGNKTTEQIVLANYFQGNGRTNIFNELAQLIVPEKVFADESGRGVIKKNLGIAIVDNNH